VADSSCLQALVDVADAPEPVGPALIQMRAAPTPCDYSETSNRIAEHPTTQDNSPPSLRVRIRIHPVRVIPLVWREYLTQADSLGPNSSLAMVSRCCMRRPQPDTGHCGDWIQRVAAPSWCPARSTAPPSTASHAALAIAVLAPPAHRAGRRSTAAPNAVFNDPLRVQHAEQRHVVTGAPSQSSSNRSGGGDGNGSATSAAHRQTVIGAGPCHGPACQLGHHSSCNRSVCSGERQLRHVTGVQLQHRDQRGRARWGCGSR
jgi:hypothetical protein